MNLTSEQKELIEILDNGKPLIGSVSVTADAGSGKTSTLVARARGFIKANPQLFEENQKKVLCVSFTERSAADLSDRLTEFVDCEVYTIHGFCARVVSEYSSLLGLSPVMQIIDADREQKLFYECFETVFKKTPLPTEEHSPQTYYRIAKEFKEKRFSIETVSLEKEKTQKFVEDVLALFNERKIKEGVLEYSDLESFALEILSRPEIAARFKKRYAHLFVDEFQDTNELQCSIVRALLSKDSFLFVVGDEKQSIYRFRGADVEVFKEFSKTLPHQKRLSKNFRSDSEVIEAVNRVCSKIIDGYEPMIVGKTSEITSETKVYRVLAESNAEGVCAIVRNLERKGVERSKIVLLLKRISGNAKLFQELRNNEIALSFSGTSSGKPEVEMMSLIHLWIWANEPKSGIYSASVLHRFSDVFKKYFKVQESEDAHRYFENWIPKCREILASDENYIYTCETLFEKLDQTFGLTERFGMKTLEFRLFLLKEQAKSVSPSRLAQQMKESLKEDGRIPSLSSLPPPPELKGSIRVMTVHASKGLEFEHVILADLQSKKPASGALISSQKKTYFAGRDDDGKLLKNDEFRHAETVEYGLEKNESARLLYVAMTRAEKGLYSVSVLPKVEGKTPDPDSWEAWLSDGILKTFSASELLGEQNAIASTVSPPVEVLKPIVVEKPKYVEARLGVTALLEKNIVEMAAADSDLEIKEKPVNFESIERGYHLSRVGTEAHRLLQFEKWDELFSYLRKEGHIVDTFADWIRSIEAKPYFNGNARIFREFAFDWKTASEPTVAGRIDRLVIPNDTDEAWIVDYKLVFSKKSPKAFSTNYIPQLKVYAEAVQKLTGRKKVRAFLIDVLGKTGKILHEVELG